MDNLEDIREWVRRLRSDKYPQTAGALHDSVGYCCLGVRCEIAVDKGELVKSEVGPTGRWGYGDVTEGWFVSDVAPVVISKQDLGDSLNDCYSLNDMPETLKDGTTSLTELNDEGFSFDQIADIIVWYFLAGVEPA